MIFPIERCWHDKCVVYKPKDLEVLPDVQLVQKALRQAELAVETLLCGAISRSLHGIVCAQKLLPRLAYFASPAVSPTRTTSEN
jgi:hypothetical protein